VVVSEVPECLPGEGGRLDRVDSSEELLVDHARG
jgi:CDP-diglyceride synthetase